MSNSSEKKYLVCDYGSSSTSQYIDSNNNIDVVNISLPEILTKRWISKGNDIYNLLDETIRQKINEIIINGNQLILVYNLLSITGEPLIINRIRELYNNNIYAIYPSIECFAVDFPDNIKTISRITISPIPSPNTPIIGYDSAPSEIISDVNGWKLFLSSESVASDIDLIKKFNINAILTVRDRPCEMTEHLLYSDISFFHVNILDRPDVNIKDHFQKTFDFINDMRSQKKNVLVHCYAGISRSATMVIAYIMQSEKKSLGDVYKFVLSKRRQISPNLGFIGQLITFNTELGFTFKMEELY